MTIELRRLLEIAWRIMGRHSMDLAQPILVFASHKEKGDIDMETIKKLLAELAPEKWSNLAANEAALLDETRTSLQKFLDAFYAYIAAYATFYERIDELREAMQYSRDQLYAFSQSFDQ